MRQEPSFVSRILLYCYSVVFELTALILLPCCRLVPKWRRQCSKRYLSSQEFKDLSAKRSTKRNCVVFYVSSAGEFEQAKPLIERLEARGYFCHTFFFSASGIDFAQKRGETTSFCLSPIDSVFRWQKYFTALKPDVSIVVRYEIWPGFVGTARRFGKLALINYSASPNKVQQWIAGRFVRWFDAVFATSETDLNTLTNAAQKPILALAQDTKYDRVVDRAKTGSVVITPQIVTYIKACRSAQKQILILGSAWMQDVNVILSGLNLLSPEEAGRLTVIVAPHDLTESNLAAIESAFRNVGHDLVRLSNLTQKPRNTNTSLLVDGMGKLAELYSMCDYCFVGGAMHHKVHNILEPAVFDLAVAFGPRYESQNEAILFVKHGIARVCQSPSDIRDWLRDCLSGKNRPSSREMVFQLRGGTDKILKTLFNMGGHV